MENNAARYTEKVVPGRITATRLVVLPLAWFTYASSILLVQIAWFLIDRLALKNENATLRIWKPSFRKMHTVAEVEARAAKQQKQDGQPSLAADVVGLGLFGWWYALLRVIRK